MKKLISIVILLSIIICTNNIKKVSLEKIDLSLNNNELGIIFMNYNGNNGLILSLNNKNILYLLKYENSSDILKYLKPLNISIDYTIMNSNYDYDGNKMIFDNYLYLNDIYFTKRDYIMINYNNINICINPNINNCDYIYYTDDIDFYINDNVKILMYNDNIKNEKIYNKWVDSYKISNNLYTILKLKDTYEVLEIPKNI